MASTRRPENAWSVVSDRDRMSAMARLFAALPYSECATNHDGAWSRRTLLGSRGYGPVRRTLLGSTSDRVIHTAVCPVVVVPRGAQSEKAAEGAATRATTVR